jgi:colanic acid/amylovoran biosynthesis protein
MAQVAVRRLARFWPDAQIDVITRSAERLAAYCPGTHPVPASGQTAWLGEGSAFGGPLYSLLVPRRLRPPAGRAEAYLRRRWPRLAHRAVRLGELRRPPQRRALTAFSQALVHADLFVVSGAGDLTSAFEPQALALLGVLEVAQTLGVRTVLLGQGIGPIEGGPLWARAKMVLPRVDFIALREKRKGLALLQECGVDAQRMVVTGDDAIEVAFAARTPELGNGIGVNLRRAPYASVDAGLVDALRPVLHAAAGRHAAPLVPVPVRIAGTDSDVATIDDLLAGTGKGTTVWEEVATPEALARRIGRCRVVVTGSYHGAVFALAQGIPAVALARADYYVDKFLGLAEMFEGGCELIYLDGPGISERVAAAIDRAWKQAEDRRPQLLDAAARQVAAGHAAYQRCRGLVPAA